MENQTELSEIENNQEFEVNAQDTQETLNSEPLSAIPEPEMDDLVYRWEEPKPQPWESAPEGLVYYEKMYEDGHLGSFTKSAELAYKFGWFDNSIPEEDLEVSDVNGWTYPKELCPHKTQAMIDRDNAIQEINQLKKQLADSDYKAIKFAEGEINPEDYLPIKNQRAEWRSRINQLQEDFNI